MRSRVIEMVSASHLLVRVSAREHNRSDSNKYAISCAGDPLTGRTIGGLRGGAEVVKT